jgi:hypothetical protein
MTSARPTRRQLLQLGIAPETRLGADGFTRPASAGRPVLDLFG